MSLDLPYLERDINGTTYRATTLPLDQWAELTEDLASMLGDPMASILRGDSVIAEGALGSAAIAAILAGVAGRITKTQLLKLARHFARGLRADGKLLTYDQQQLYWPGHMRDLAQVAGLFLEAQYEGFFEGLAALLPPAPSGEADPSQRGNG